jgi:hypothetical protein
MGLCVAIGAGRRGGGGRTGPRQSWKFRFSALENHQPKTGLSIAFLPHPKHPSLRPLPAFETLIPRTFPRPLLPYRVGVEHTYRLSRISGLASYSSHIPAPPLLHKN